MNLSTAYGRTKHAYPMDRGRADLNLNKHRPGQPMKPMTVLEVRRTTSAYSYARLVKRGNYEEHRPSFLTLDHGERDAL